MSYIQDAIDAIDAELPGLAPGLARLYALLALVKGLRTSVSDVHDAWAVWCHRSRPDHPGIVPFEQLPEEVRLRELDERYVGGIHQAARRLRGRPEPPAGGPDLNLPVLGRRQRLTQDQRDAAAAELLRHYREGYTVLQLSEAAGAGYSFSTVRRLLGAGALRHRSERVPGSRPHSTGSRWYPAGALAEACPTCGAEVQRRCRVMSGPDAGMPAVMPHVARVRLARGAPVVVDGTTIQDATPFRTGTR